MIRYAIDEKSNFVLKPYDKYLSVFVTTQTEHIRKEHHTGIHFWLDDGTVLLIKNIQGDWDFDVLVGKQELILSTENQTAPYLLPGRELARLIPVASAYYGSIEMEQVRIEWFNPLLTE